MDVQLSAEQDLLRKSAREFLERECPMRLVRAVMEGDEPTAELDALWTRMAALGWMGLPFPEAAGGAGLGLVDLALLFEEMGRVLMPAPFWSTVALGGLAIAWAGTREQQTRLLPGICDGSLRATLVLRDEQGRALFVPDADRADWLVLPAGQRLRLVDAKAPGVQVRPIAFTDGTRQLCEVTVEGDVPEAGPALERVLDAARVALAAEMCGGAARVLELSVEFAKTREQFGAPIGSFQAIQHKCADMLVKVESARSAALYAAWHVDEDEREHGGHAAACMAKAYCSEAFSAVAAAGIQIHGGLGFTWEQDLHLYYKRAKAGELLLGDPTWCREQVAVPILDGSGARGVS